MKHLFIISCAAFLMIGCGKTEPAPSEPKSLSDAMNSMQQDLEKAAKEAEQEAKRVAEELEKAAKEAEEAAKKAAAQPAPAPME